MMLFLISPTRIRQHLRSQTAWSTSETRVPRTPVQRSAKTIGSQESDRTTCEKLFTEFGPRMLSVARRMLRSEEDAADAVQDAFVSALAAIHRFRADARISTWLHRIVVNTCLMKLRSRKRREMLSLESLMSSFDGNGQCVQPFDPWAAQASEHAASNEMRATVRESIDRLPEDFRAILILRDIEELDTEETAAILGLSRSATKTRLHRARQALRAELSPMLDDEKLDSATVVNSNQTVGSSSKLAAVD